MSGNVVSWWYVALALGTFTVCTAQAADGPYKVIYVETFSMEAEINKLAKEGWVLRAITTSNQCSDRKPDGTKKSPECQVIIFERRN